MKFKPYQHVQRMGVDEVDGILDGNVVIQPKIDGTNASIWLDENGTLGFGNRRRKLTLEKDNAGFMTFFTSEMAQGDAAKLQEYLEDNPDYTIYGEWLVQHVVHYKDNVYHQLFIFDVYDNANERYLNIEEYQDDLQELGMSYVVVIPAIYKGKATNEMIVKLAKDNHYLLEKDQVGEGVVVKRYDFVNRYGRTTWGKYVLADFKKRKHDGHDHYQDVDGIGNSYAEPIAKFITPAFVEKEFIKFKERLDHPFSGKDIPALLGTVYHEFVSEETWHFLKELGKSPVVNFGTVQRESYKQIKRCLPVLFGQA